MQIKPFLPAILWGCIIIVLSLIPGGGVKISLFEWKMFDKLAHAGFYAVWTFLIAYGFQLKRKRAFIRREAYLSLGTAITLGILLEFLQASLTVQRHFEGLDILANIIGSFTGILILKILTKHIGYALNKF